MNFWKKKIQWNLKSERILDIKTEKWKLLSNLHFQFSRDLAARWTEPMIFRALEPLSSLYCKQLDYETLKKKYISLIKWNSIGLPYILNLAIILTFLWSYCNQIMKSGFYNIFPTDGIAIDGFLRRKIAQKLFFFYLLLFGFNVQIIKKIISKL